VRLRMGTCPCAEEQQHATLHFGGYCAHARRLGFIFDLVGLFGDGLRFATGWHTPELQFR
jgi:hypothetical protein